MHDSGLISGICGRSTLRSHNSTYNNIIAKRCLFILLWAILEAFELSYTHAPMWFISIMNTNEQIPMARSGHLHFNIVPAANLIIEVPVT